jgi:succinate-semialdehyde dehydrogenase/glutarate-semialdehyde dehydrogenase
MKTHLTSLDPSTGLEIQRYPVATEAQVLDAITQAYEAWQLWRRTALTERTGFLNNAARILLRQKQEFALLMAREMGKPVAQGVAEIEKCGSLCEYYAQHGPAFLQPEPVATDASKSYVAYHPLGIVLSIMPWNFPFWQAFRCAVPALLAGNAVLLKHSSNVSGCSLAIESVFHESGLPSALFRSLLIGSESIPTVLEHPHVKAVSLTGSTPAGREVAAIAGFNLKKCVLELGGSDPYVVLADADLDQAVPLCVKARLINSGQSCIAAKRFIVMDALYDEFVRRFVQQMKQAKMGHPTEPGVEVGPMARPDLRDELHQQVTRSVEAGAKLLLGGVIPTGRGAFYPPTVLADVVPGMVAFDEELFGPVAAITRAQDESEALTLANATVFGLGAAVFTKDKVRGECLANEFLNAGLCFVNTFVRSDPRLPFGGINKSGFGRELGLLGIREFVNAKTVFVA